MLCLTAGMLGAACADTPIQTAMDRVVSRLYEHLTPEGEIEDSHLFIVRLMLFNRCFAN